ncbi:MAG TPA: YggS family pyridoxal phosphate-dependent enzyme [Anaerolineae bacterium]
MSVLSDNLHRVRERIAAAARRTGREASEVTLVAVAKTQPPEAIVEAARLGVRHFGENRVEEAALKIPAVESAIEIPKSEITWHMIGHVQSRKAEAASSFDWIHSVESAKLAERLSRFAGQRGKTLNVLLEFNVSGEESKYGLLAPDGRVDDAELLQEIEAIVALPNLRVDGVMTMAPIVADAGQTRPIFRALRQVRDQLAQRFPQSPWRHLSMGMTDDFEVAVEEGATLVRIGRAIFGERPPTSNSHARFAGSPTSMYGE